MITQAQIEAYEEWQRRMKIEQEAAAAEVGEQPHLTHSVDYLEGIAEGKAATIERCAQVADRFFNEPGAGVYRKIAAAIRALKDKP